MRFRPCIDIHNGKVKQIVGGSLSDAGDTATDNFVSDADASYYGSLYREKNLPGGHVILLNALDSPYYEADLREARKALSAYPGGLAVGGGVTAETAPEFIRMGASHVIVTSYVFREGRVDMERLAAMVAAVGRKRLILDLSCRKKDGKYYIVTDRWQTFTETEVNLETLSGLSEYCDEFLVHGVDVEGKSAGIDTELVRLLGTFTGIPVTYAGGVHSMEDLRVIRDAGGGRLDVTIGSALSLFGGTLDLDEVLSYLKEE